MPFVSQRQRRWMHANRPEMAARWEAHTPDGAKLPEHSSDVRRLAERRVRRRRARR